MLKRHSWQLVCAALVLGGLVSFHPLVAQNSPPAVSRAKTANEESGEAFMLAKLQATHSIVDGLAFEDFAKIEKGADDLLRVATEASWKVRRNPIYMHYATDFEETAVRLRAAARDRSIEKATFAYMHLTVSCTACHRHVRNVIQIAPANAKFEPAKGPIFR